jgi:hypothetical protein
MYDQNSAYPYLLINAFDETTLDYVNHKSTRFIKSVIVDAGVHSVFHRHELQEYPGGYQHWIARVARLWRIVSRLVADSYVVIPDYPADYENNEIADNVERTFRNIDYAVKKYPDVRWIIPIQGKKDDVVSVVKSFEYIRDSGLLERYNYIAIAPTCTTNNFEVSEGRGADNMEARQARSRGGAPYQDTYVRRYDEGMAVHSAVRRLY